MNSEGWSITQEPSFVNVYHNDIFKGKYNRIKDPCIICSYPLENKLCRNMNNHFRFLDRLYSIGAYIDYNIRQDFLSKHINYLKSYKKYVYPLGLSISRYMTEMVYDFDYILYVPQHESEYHKDKDTGEIFDQASLLVHTVGNIKNKPVLKLLIKTKPLSQRGQNAEQRRKNSEGLYACNDGPDIPKLKDSHIVLMDDVVTTGSDIDECSKVLKKYNPKRIDGFVCGITKKS